MDPALSTDEEALLDPSGSQSGRKSSLSINSLHVLSVNQLLESVSNIFHLCLIFTIVVGSYQINEASFFTQMLALTEHLMLDIKHFDGSSYFNISLDKCK